MQDLIEMTIDGVIKQNDIINYLVQNGATPDLLTQLGIRQSEKQANVFNDILDTAKNNKPLMVGIIALMLLQGKLFAYTVQKGDNLSSIAKKTGCTLSQIYQLNPQIKNKKYIFPGQNIVTPKKATNVNQNKETLNLDAAVYALKKVQSNCGKDTRIGDNGKAVGQFQLWEIFVKEYHRLGGKKEYQCHVVNGKVQADDVRLDPKKSEQMVRFVLSKLKYHNMTEVIRGYKNVQGWNSKVSDATLQKYLDAYNSYILG